jgi:competence protein ComGC
MSAQEFDMFRNEQGFSVYAIISVILLLALIFVLALPNFFNLDKGKNEEDCINNMKLLWVASSDYMKDNSKDFDGSVTLFKTLTKKSNPKENYVPDIPTCPESRGSGSNYIVYGKYFEELMEGTKKLNYGSVIICPNLARNPKHFIPKSFYENMEPTELQNYFIDDLDAINTKAGNDGKRKQEMMLRYIEIWKTDATALSRIRLNPLAIRNQIIPSESAAAEPTN